MTAALVVAATTAFAVDQATKALVLRVARREGGPSPAWNGVTLVRNRRPAFAAVRRRPLLLAAWALAAAGALVASSSAALAPVYAQVGLGAAIGGASGNVLDHLRRGYVVDFVPLPFWRTFNAADAAITFGAGVAVAAYVL